MLGDASDIHKQYALSARRANAVRIEREARTVLHGFSRMSVFQLKLLRDHLPEDLSRSVRDAAIALLDAEIARRKR